MKHAHSFLAMNIILIITEVMLDTGASEDWITHPTFSGIALIVSSKHSSIYGRKGYVHKLISLIAQLFTY